jgi:hypothetical protein
MRNSNQRIHLGLPRPAPHLPRNHFAMRPQISKTQRVMRAIVFFAVLIYGASLWLR